MQAGFNKEQVQIGAVSTTTPASPTRPTERSTSSTSVPSAARRSSRHRAHRAGSDRRLHRIVRRSVLPLRQPSPATTRGGIPGSCCLSDHGRASRARGVASVAAALRGRVRTRRRTTVRASCSRLTPRNARLLYNITCCESLAGRKEDAIAHLRLAIEIAAPLRDFAAGGLGLRSAARRAGVREPCRVEGTCLRRARVEGCQALCLGKHGSGCVGLRSRPSAARSPR